MARLPPGLDDRTRALMAPHVPPDMGLLEAIGTTLCAKRDEAVEARRMSGIELIWYEAERAYAGIDDANMHLFPGSRWQKPRDLNGPLTKSTRGQDEIKSNLFVPITARYTKAGAAKLAEILVPIDEKAFGIEATPLPSSIELKDNPDQVIHPELGPLTRPAKPDEIAAGQQPAPVPSPGAPAAIPAPAAAGGAGLPVPSPAGAAGPQEPPEVPLTHSDVAKSQIEAAQKKAKKAETRMYDWLVECDYAGQKRKIIDDEARLGVGILKGPFPSAQTNRMVKTDGGRLAFITEEKVVPAGKWVDPWNCYPDPHCGEHVADGDFFWERDLLTETRVAELAELPGYISSQIEKVLKEGPNKAYLATEEERPGRLRATEGRYEAWYFTGRLKRDDLDCICHAAGKPLLNHEAVGRMPSVVVTMINDTVVRAAPNPLESGGLGYNNAVWERRVGSWAGKGVPEQIQAAQRMVNGATRRLLDNAGLAAGSQIVMDPSKIRPADGNPQMTPNKLWYLTSDGAGVPINQIFDTFDIPIYTEELLKIQENGMRIAEESTSIPLITQGQSGPTMPDTASGMQLQNNNANQLLRAHGYADDAVTKRFIGWLYEWLLTDPNVPDDEKGDFRVLARGSAVLVERAIADQSVLMAYQNSLDPRSGGNPRKAYIEVLKTQRLDPRNFTNTPEEQAEVDKKAAQAPQAPQVAVAQIKAQTDAQRMQLEAQENAADRELRKHEVHTDTVIRLNEAEDRKDADLRKMVVDMQKAMQNMQTILAKTVMSLDAQRDLSRREQVAEAAAEPPERAEPGEGFVH